MKTPFPSIIDASLVSSWRACPRKAQLEYFQHWKPRVQSVHLHAGAAFASGLEAAREAFYVNGRSAEDSVVEGLDRLLHAYGDFECPADSAKSRERMLGALEYYFFRYPLGDDRAVPITLPGGKRGIEFSFLQPLDLAHPETGDPLLYSGRFDMLCNYNGLTLGEDDKTTSSLGNSWALQWDLRSQFTGYCWGAGRMGIQLNGFLVRGVSILKTKYDTAEAITYRHPWQVEQWHEQLIRDLRCMMVQWEEGYFDFNLADSCTSYGSCLFRNVCLMREPDTILQQQFQRRIWNPVTRTETVIEHD